MRSRLSALLVAALAGGTLLPVGVPAAAAHCPPDAPAEVEASDAAVSSHDGVEIAITVFRPADVCTDSPAPLILHGHGWSGSRATEVTDEIRPFLDAGYGVVSIDARGHGASGGEAQIMHRDAEVGDYRAVLDWLFDNLDWAARDPDPAAPKDLVVGAYGASYGGGYQLMTAAFDDRLDALVPIVTWHDLAESLAPNGVPRSAWLDLLYAAGEANVNLDPRIRQWFLQITATGEVPDDAREHVAGSSPANFLGQIDPPTLLIQGLPDTLFTLNDAVGNYLGLQAAGTDVRLLGINTGHVLPAVQPTGINAPDRTAIDVCLPAEGYVLDFYATHLRADAAATDRLAGVPRVALATEQGGCVTADDWPVPAEDTVVELPGIVAPEQGGSLLLPLLSAEEETTIAGIPLLSGTVPADLLDDRFFVSLVLRRGDGGHIVEDQVTPIRTQLAGDDAQLTVELAGVATTMAAGDQLLLRVDGANEQFATASSRTPGLALLQDVTVTLPVVLAQQDPGGSTGGTTGGGSTGGSGGSTDGGAGGATTGGSTGGGTGSAPSVGSAGSLPATGSAAGVLGLLLLALGLGLALGLPRPFGPGRR